ncbi:hypothetical protein HZU73_05063 [Apis mellifera caucasica]|nr:hypothetical protein HZU73_05063 [Apis mellifera caucasica]
MPKVKSRKAEKAIADTDEKFVGQGGCPRDLNKGRRYTCYAGKYPAWGFPSSYIVFRGDVVRKESFFPGVAFSAQQLGRCPN